MFGILTLAGNVVGGSVAFSATALTAAITDSDTTIYVVDTTGFPASGIIVIDNETIAYSDLAPDHFGHTLGQPMVRGSGGTEAASHAAGAIVRTQESGMMNASVSYSIASIADASGLQAFISVPIAFFRLITSFILVPLDFLGSDLAWLTYLWAIFGLGFLVALTVTMAGGRRV